MFNRQYHSFLEGSDWCNHKCFWNSVLCLGPFPFEENCSDTSMRSHSQGRLSTWGATRVMHTVSGEEMQRSLCQHISYAPLQQANCRKLSPVILPSTSLPPWPHKPGYKHNCWCPRELATVLSNSCCLCCRSWQTGKDSVFLASE